MRNTAQEKFVLNLIRNYRSSSRGLDSVYIYTCRSGITICIDDYRDSYCVSYFAQFDSVIEFISACHIKDISDLDAIDIEVLEALYFEGKAWLKIKDYDEPVIVENEDAPKSLKFWQFGGRKYFEDCNGSFNELPFQTDDFDKLAEFSRNYVDTTIDIFEAEVLELLEVVPAVINQVCINVNRADVLMQTDIGNGLLGLPIRLVLSVTMPRDAFIAFFPVQTKEELDGKINQRTLYDLYIAGIGLLRTEFYESDTGRLETLDFKRSEPITHIYSAEHKYEKTIVGFEETDKELVSQTKEFLSFIGCDLDQGCNTLPMLLGKTIPSRWCKAD